MHVYRDAVNRLAQFFFLAQVLSAFVIESGEGRVRVELETIGDEEKSAAAGIQVVARAAAVLRALEGKPEGLSLAQIAREVGLARSTVQRIVAALAAEDFVSEAQPGRGVRIGAGLARIAASISSNITDILHPHLVGLRDEVGETVDLSILSGGSAVFIDQIAGQQRLVALSGIGERFPLHCTANGKAILACFTKQDAIALIDKSVAEHPHHPLSDRTKLLRELDTVRRRNLAFDLGEHYVGIAAASAAVLDAYGRPVAVSIPAPTHRFSAERESISTALTAFREKMRAFVGR